MSNSECIRLFWTDEALGSKSGLGPNYLAFMKRKCPSCGEVVKGRSDKIYCDDGCRNAHHNHHRPVKPPTVRLIQRQLEQNYQILKSLKERGFREVHEEFLRGQGFDPRFVTEWCTNQSKRIVFDIVLEQRRQNHFQFIE